MKTTYVKTQIKNLINITKLVTIHYYEFDKNFRFDGESHNFWEMVYVDKGQVLIKRDKEEFVVNQGGLIFHKPNEFHAIKAHQSEPSFFVVSFSCNSPSMVYLENFHTKLDKTLQSYISAIIKESENTFVIPKNDTTLKILTLKENSVIGGQQLIKTYLEQLLILLIRKINKIGNNVFPNKESMENHLAVSIKQYLEQNVENQLKITDVCKKLGYSKSYLSKIFHEQTGCTIANYCNYVKIKQAKKLIRENNLNFAQISDKLSFDNPQYFSRVFKRFEKITPTAFKKTLSLEE